MPGASLRGGGGELWPALMEGGQPHPPRKAPTGRGGAHGISGAGGGPTGGCCRVKVGRTDGSGQGAVGRGASHGDVETILPVVVAGVRWRVNTHAVRIFPNSVRVAGVQHARFSETWNDPIGWCRHPVFSVPNQPEMIPYRQFKYNIEKCFQDKNKKQAADH